MPRDVKRSAVQQANADAVPFGEARASVSDSRRVRSEIAVRCDSVEHTSHNLAADHLVEDASAASGEEFPFVAAVDFTDGCPS